MTTHDASAPAAAERLWTGLVTEPLPVADALAFLTDERAGGTCLFLGTTRRWTGGDETDALDYDAYEALAEADLARLATEAADRWSLAAVVLLHRTGRVAVAEPSVIAAAASPHRDAAFVAARWLIDTLKADVPIWKRDLAPNGSSRWPGSSTP